MAQILIDNVNRTLKLGTHTFVSLIQGDAVTITFPNDNVTYTIGSNDTVLAKKMLNGDVADVNISVIKYSDDDKFLSTQSELSTPSFIDGSLQTNYTKDGVDGVEVVDFTSLTVKKKADYTYNTADGEEVITYICQARRAKRIV